MHGRSYRLVLMCVRALQEEMVEPAVRGTRYVIDAAAESGTVRRVVLTSSIGAVAMDPSRAPDAVVDESCWSDLEFCKKTKVRSTRSTTTLHAPGRTWSPAARR